MQQTTVKLGIQPHGMTSMSMTTALVGNIAQGTGSRFLVSMMMHTNNDTFFSFYALQMTIGINNGSTFSCDSQLLALWGWWHVTIGILFGNQFATILLLCGTKKCKKNLSHTCNEQHALQHRPFPNESFHPSCIAIGQ